MSRTANSIKNIITSNASQMLVIVLNFVVRTVLIYSLGSEYLGINNLFSNILQLLSLTELGVGTAITFRMYKPIEFGNIQRVVAFMTFYKKVYRIIGCVIVALGLIIAPFLPYIISDFEKFSQLHINPYLLFGLYVLKTASTYCFFAYKQAVISANQKKYLMTTSEFFVNIASSVTQIVALVVFKSFILFTFIMLLFVVIQNIVYAGIADKNFPYIKNKPTEKISKAEEKEIFKDCGALLIYKSSYAVITATDNIIISAFMGLNAVGIFSNYLVIVTNLRTLLSSILSSVQASIGSINATGIIDWKRKTFKAVNFASILLYGTVAIGVGVMMNDFIKLWLGNDYIINTITFRGTTYHYSLPLLIAIEIYIIGYNSFLSNFRQSFGLFRQLKLRPIFTMIINLVVGIVMTKYIGVSGTVLGTIFGYLFTVIIADPIVIIKNSLEESPKKYFIDNLFYTVVTVIAGCAAWGVCSFFHEEGIVYFILKGCTCVAVTVAVYFVCFFKTKSFKLLMAFLPKKIRNKIPFLTKK